MGFTRYYTITGHLDSDKFIEYSKIAEAVCRDITKIYGHKLAGWDGEGDPEFTDIKISFNGELDDSCETFHISKNSKGFNFCKTRQLPYDMHVYACIILAKIFFGNSIEISSDGDDEDYYREISSIIKSNIRDLKISSVLWDINRC